MSGWLASNKRGSEGSPGEKRSGRAERPEKKRRRDPQPSRPVYGGGKIPRFSSDAFENVDSNESVSEQGSDFSDVDGSY